MILVTMGTVATSGEVPYWLGVTSGTGNKTIYRLASNTNNLAVAAVSTPSNNEAQVYYMTKGGAINWQRSLATSGADIYYGVGLDSSDNLYLAGQVTPSDNECVLAKYNSSGTLQWQRTLATTTYSDKWWDLAVTTAGDCYAAGHDQDAAGGLNTLIAKYNTSGTIQWQRRLRQSADNDQAFAVALDSSSDPHIAGYTSATTNALIAKWNNAGTFQWQRGITSATSMNTPILRDISIDASNNIYIAGYGTDSFANLRGIVGKLTSTPGVTWFRELDSADGDIFYGVATDSASNVYVCGYTTVSSVLQGLIVKYNSSGTLQWQRTISQAANVILLGIHIDSADVLYVCGYTSISSVNQGFMARLPNDGSLTGTYSLSGVSFTYAASSLTGSSPAHTLNTPTLTAGTPTLTDAAGTATDAATTITFTTQTV